MKIINKIHKTPLKYLARLLPVKVKPICIRILGNMGLYDRPASVSLDQLFEDDIFLVSYPRSGNSWVRFLIASILHPEITISLRNIGSYVPDIHMLKSKEYNSMKRPCFIKSHFRSFSSYPKFIYIYRDGRDVMVSFYFYCVHTKSFSGTFSEFIYELLQVPTSKSRKAYGAWHEHVSLALNYARQYPDKVLLLKYEKLAESPLRCAYKIAEFCKMNVRREIIKEAVKKCSFDNLKKIEKKYGSEKTKFKNYVFFRCGKIGQWKNMFSKQDMDLFLSKAGPELKKLGYI